VNQGFSFVILIPFNLREYESDITTLIRSFKWFFSKMLM
jgi:flagellar assembly factor FliW